VSYSSVKDLPTGLLRRAIDEASSHVSRQQHVGTHEQDRYDAMAWRERYTEHGRCKCVKCKRAWAAGDPSKR
jgi:hypothetical protein